MTDVAEKFRGSFADLLKFVVDNELLLRGKTLESHEREQVDMRCTEIARIVEELA